MAGNDVYLYSVPSDADSDDVRLRDPTVAGAGGPVNASLTASIGQITLASDVDVIVGAAMTASVGNITLTSDVDVVVGASLTASIGAITLTSDVDVIVGASLTASVGDIALASAVAIGGAAVTADLTASIGQITLAASASVKPDAATRNPWLRRVDERDLPPKFSRAVPELETASLADVKVLTARAGPAPQTDDEEEEAIIAWLLAA